MLIIGVAVSVFILLSRPAWAYLDPGTSSLLLQGIIAALATLSVSVSLGWRHLKNAFTEIVRRLFKRSVGNADKRQD